MRKKYDGYRKWANIFLSKWKKKIAPSEIVFDQSENCFIKEKKPFDPNEILFDPNEIEIYSDEIGIYMNGPEFCAVFIGDLIYVYVNPLWHRWTN